MPHVLLATLTRRSGPALNACFHLRDPLTKADHTKMRAQRPLREQLKHEEDWNPQA
jgi:hypothetical protein